VIVAPDRVIFDAEALIAHADDGLGSDAVEEYLDAVAAEDTAGYARCVNLAEIRRVVETRSPTLKREPSGER
jgi:hypothetical protein